MISNLVFLNTSFFILKLSVSTKKLPRLSEEEFYSYKVKEEEKSCKCRNGKPIGQCKNGPMESKRKDDKEKDHSAGRRRRSVDNTLNVDLSNIDPMSQEDTIPNTVINSRLKNF